MKKDENKQKTESLKAQSVWLLFAKIVGFALSFLLPLFIVRFLSQENVGLYRESFQVIVDVTAILPLGFSMSAYYFLSRETERRGAAILNILLFNFVVGGAACLALFFYPQILGNIFQSEQMTALAPKIGIVIWLWIFSTFLETVAIANQEARLATGFIILSQFSKTLLMLVAVFLFSTVESFLYAAMIQGVFQIGILVFYLNSRFPKFWTDFRFAFFAEQMYYAVPFGLTAVLGILQTSVHNYFVGHKFSSAEYAIYAYGCFQVPLIGMLAESVSSVLIPRMSALQATNDTKEIIRLTTRAMQKLAVFYFPLYVLLMITAQTFIITLFTKNYLASVPIFMINLTLLPFSILLVDPIVRAYKEFGRFLVILRTVVVGLLLAVLYFYIDRLSMSGMIAVAMTALLAEKFIGEAFLFRRLKVSLSDLYLLKDVGKTAVVTLIAGLITLVFYTFTKDHLFDFGEEITAQILQTSKISVLNFFGGGFTMFVTTCVFAPIYLFGIYYWNILEEQEIKQFKSIINKLLMFFKKRRIHNPQSQIQN
jgi:O-antigen/teichoic acid export membrane protein